jgi:hypothetical protein
MKDQSASFQLDRRARSFRVSDFALRDLPLLALAFVVVTLFSLVVAWFVKLLPENARWICLGLAPGFYLGIVFNSWCQRSASRSPAAAQPAPTEG